MIRFLILFLVLLITAAKAESISLEWDMTPDEPNVAGCNVWWGTASGMWTEVKDVGNVRTATIDGLDDGVTYFFIVTVRNSAGLESAPSNEVSGKPKSNKPLPPTNIKVGISHE
jgi:hypothetical protein